MPTSRPLFYKRFPAWLRATLAAIFVGLPVGSIGGGIAFAIVAGLSHLIALANPALGLVCGIMAGIGFIGGGAVFSGKWWQRLIAGLVIAGLAATPYALMVGLGIAGTTIAIGSVVLGVAALIAWLAWCQHRAILDPLTPVEHQQVASLVQTVKTPLNAAKKSCAQALNSSPDDPMLIRINEKLKQVEAGIVGQYAQDKKRLAKAGKKQYFKTLKITSKVNPETGKPQLSERARYQESAQRLKSAVDNPDWLVPFDIRFYLDFKTIVERLEALNPKRSQSLAQADKAWQAWDRLDIMRFQEPLFVYLQQLCEAEPLTEEEQAQAENYTQYCLALFEAQDPEGASRATAFSAQMSGRHLLSERLAKASTLLDNLETAYDLSAAPATRSIEPPRPSLLPEPTGNSSKIS